MCFCVYTNVGGWHGPCPTFCCECAGLEHRLICHGGSLHCLCLHQSHKIPLFSWPYKQGASVIVSVANGMYYIMARFFVGWCNLNMMHKIPLPPLYSVAMFKTVALATKLICTVLKYLLAYLIRYRYWWFMAIALFAFLTQCS